MRGSYSNPPSPRRRGSRVHNPHEPFHQAVAVDRQHLPRQACRPAVEPCGGIACQVALRPEQQRVGRSRKTFVHAPAEYPHVGQRHVGNTLHGGRNPGPRGTYLPPHGRHIASRCRAPRRRSSRPYATPPRPCRNRNRASWCGYSSPPSTADPPSPRPPSATNTP